MADAIFWMGMGAAAVIFMLVMKLGASKCWSAIQAWLKSRASAAEAKLKAQADAIDGHIKDLVHSELAKLESDIAALKAKVGI